MILSHDTSVEQKATALKPLPKTSELHVLAGGVERIPLCLIKKGLGELGTLRVTHKGSKQR